MASVFYLCHDAYDIKQKIVEKYSDFAESDKKLFFSALCIQRTWRTYSVRKMIKNWNKQATTIQRFVRGWLVRLHLPDYLKEYYLKLGIKHYNEQATKIQALWHGYCTRKVVFSIKTVLAERKEVEQISQGMQELMKKSFDALREKKERECLEKVLEILFDRHHLLRTEIQEGIFSIHGSNKFSCIEKILQSFPLTAYMEELHSLLPKEDSCTENKKKKKRFDLSSRVKEKPYERMLISQD